MNDWHSCHVYIPPDEQDLWLVNEALPALKSWKDRDPLRYQFFFMRYSDAAHSRELGLSSPAHTGSHLRIRTNPAPLLEIIEVTSLYECQASPYSPELDRYGGEDSLKASERIFGIDSEIVLELFGLQCSDGSPTKEVRSCVAASLIFSYFSLFECRDDLVQSLHNASAYLFELIGCANPLSESKRQHLANQLATVLNGTLQNKFVVRHNQGVNSLASDLNTQSSTILSLMHMCCNRCGLSVVEEGILYQLLAILAADRRVRS